MSMDGGAPVACPLVAHAAEADAADTSGNAQWYR
jgi:hypothetical protein